MDAVLPLRPTHQAPARRGWCATSVILRGLSNPRGLRIKDDGSLLLVEAGTGDAEQPFSGRLLQFKPDGAGGFFAPETLAAGFRSMNMQARMCRDEIFGLADVALGGGRCLLSQTDYVDGSRILDLASSPPTPIFYSRGNLNALCYHPQRNSWLTVKPDTNQVIEFVENQPEAVRGVLAPLAGGQESVPVTLICEPGRETVLVSLFSGELRRDPGKTGIEFEPQIGKVVRVDLCSGTVTPIIEGLTLPTGIAFTAQGQLLVLELCDDFLQAMPAVGVPECPWHGGFKRFSGRLRSFDLHTGTVITLAEQLDTPSNLCVVGKTVLISEGMGLPGRPIANAVGDTTPLEGFVRKLTLPPEIA
ncbi:hypothetical protein AAKU55_001603 [Oxalobacteraceae bacterium GrIS 1.11]